MKTPGKTETFENGDLSGDFKTGGFENRVFRCVNTQDENAVRFQLEVTWFHGTKMAVLEAFRVDPIIVTHASLINFRWTE